jgi:REP element-mobilizing transposase RayT
VQFRKRIRLPKPAYGNTDAAFHIVIRAHPEVRSWSNEVRNAIWNVLMQRVVGDDIVVHAALLMPDHLHLIVQPASRNLIAWVGALKSRAARATWPLGIRGTPCQPRFYDRGLRGDEEYQVAMEYVLRNPSSAGLVDDDDSWPWRWVRTDQDPS